MLPMALTGALVAGVSSRDSLLPRHRGPRRASRRAMGPPAGPATPAGRRARPCPRPPGAGRRLRNRATADGGGGGDPVAGRGRADAEREDDEPGRTGHPGVAWARGRSEREVRPPPRHAGAAPRPRPGVVRRPHRRPPGSPRAPGRRSRGAPTGAAPPGRRPTCARRRRRTGPRLTASSGTRPRRSSWRPSCSRRRVTAAPWPTWCVGSTPRRRPRWPTRWTAPACPRRSTRHAPPGVATSEPAARSTRRLRRCSPPSPRHNRGPVSAEPFEPRHLLGGPHTLYLCAPAHDQRRLRGYFGALVAQVLSHSFSVAHRAGHPLDPPLLVVLDEAAHIAPLPELDGLAATCALPRDPAGDGLAGPGTGQKSLRHSRRRRS